MSEYIVVGGELYHYGVKGMKWGVRKKYYNSDGSLNSAGQARQNYKDAKRARREAQRNYSFNSGGFGISGIARATKAQNAYRKAAVNEVTAKAKFKAAKSKNSDKAEFNTYRKAMQKTGLVGSAKDASSGGRSTDLYNKIKAEKGKEYADRVQRKVQNVAVAQIATSAVVLAGSMIAEQILLNRR